MLQYFQTWLLKLLPKSWCLQQGLNFSQIKTATCESSWVSFSLHWKNVRKRRGIHTEELTERLERLQALACSIQEIEWYCYPACDLLFAFWQMLFYFLHFAWCIPIRNPQPDPFLKASGHSSLVSISTKVMFLTFKSQDHMYYTLWKKKGWITALDRCHDILVSRTEAHLMACVI